MKTYSVPNTSLFIVQITLQTLVLLFLGFEPFVKALYLGQGMLLSIVLPPHYFWHGCIGNILLTLFTVLLTVVCQIFRSTGEMIADLDEIKHRPAREPVDDLLRRHLGNIGILGISLETEVRLTFANA